MSLTTQTTAGAAVERPTPEALRRAALAVIDEHLDNLKRCIHWLIEHAVTDAIMVTKGVTARVVLREGGLQISGYAVPLESGSAGSIVRLKNLDSGQIIVGEVQADGSVRIKMR